MQKALSIVFVLTAYLGLSGASIAGDHAKDEQEIKGMIAAMTRAYHDRDVDGSVAMYRNSQFMLFDIVPPRKDCCGFDGMYKKTKSFMEGTVGPVKMEWTDVQVTAGDEIAYATAFLNFTFTVKKDGKKATVDNARSTWVFKRIDGKWTCIHEHDSVPTFIAFSW